MVHWEKIAIFVIDSKKSDSMKQIHLLLAALVLILASCKTEYAVRGPQGGIATTLRVPKGKQLGRDSLEVLVLMHGIFSSKSYPPIPRLARSLAKQGIATLTMDFGGHGRSQGRKVSMTIEKEIAEGRAVYDYACSLPMVKGVSLLGHSQGGVVASMLAGRLAQEGRAPQRLMLLAPGAVIKEACQGGHFFGQRFDPRRPPKYIKCFGIYKLGHDYLTSTQKLDIYGTSAHYQGPVCILHGTRDRIVPLWCSRKYDSIYRRSTLHLIEGETHTMHKKLKQTTRILGEFMGKGRL